MTISRRWDPLRDLLDLQEKMNRLFEDSLAATRPEGGLPASAVDTNGLPGHHVGVEVILAEHVLYVPDDRIQNPHGVPYSLHARRP